MLQFKDKDCQTELDKGPAISYLQETYFKYKNSKSVKVNGWIKIYLDNTNPRKAGVAILISNKKWRVVS